MFVLDLFNQMNEPNMSLYEPSRDEHLDLFTALQINRVNWVKLKLKEHRSIKHPNTCVIDQREWLLMLWEMSG